LEVLLIQVPLGLVALVALGQVLVVAHMALDLVVPLEALLVVLEDPHMDLDLAQDLEDLHLTLDQALVVHL